MMQTKRLMVGLLGGGVLLSALGCGATPALVKGPRATTPLSAHFTPASRGLTATVLQPGAVPVALRDQVLPRAQRAADDTSRRRKIDFFGLHDNPVGVQLSWGDDAAYVLNFLGTARTRNDLNLEMRTLVGERAMGSTMNYTGTATLSRTQPTVTSPAAKARGNGFEFDLLLSSVPAHIDEAYGTAMTRLAKHLSDRYDARPIDLFGDVTVFTVERAEGSLAELVVFARGCVA